MLLLLHQVQVVDWVEDGLLRVVIGVIDLGGHLRVEAHLWRLFDAPLGVYLVSTTLDELAAYEIVAGRWLGAHGTFRSVFLVTLLIYIRIEKGLVTGVMLNLLNVGRRVVKILLVTYVFEISVIVAFFSEEIRSTATTSHYHHMRAR